MIQLRFSRLAWTLVLLVAAGLALAGPVLAQAKPSAVTVAVVEAETEWDSGFFDRAAAGEQQRFLHTWLRSEAARGGAGLELEISEERLLGIEKAQTVGGRLRIGLVQDADLALDLTDAGSKSAALAFGASAKVRDGWVWTGTVSSPGAAALRVRFADVALPNGVELYVYNARGEAFGPYTGFGPLGTGEFWSNTVAGGELFVQVRAFESRMEKAARVPAFRIAGVGHLGPDFQAALFGAPAAGEKAFCSFNASCVQNASCSSVPSAIQPARNAVAHMLFASGGFLYICSGGLLADTVSTSQIPYFLTANHCISRSNEASSLEAFFQFSTPCNGSCYDPDGVVPRTLGSTIKATGKTGDYNLLQLSQPAPAGSAFLGWSNAAVANTNNTPLYRISHPKGAPQAYSAQAVSTSAGTCGTLPRGTYIYSRDTVGGTEGGSSGSPILNASGQVVGQLYGACGTNVNDSCDSASNATVDGAMAAYWANVAPFLSPGGACPDSDGDGSCDSADCDDFDATVFPGAPESCDGKDNDCDGSIDEGCGSCLALGATCTSNAQCCSNNCKGKAGAKTCK